MLRSPKSASDQSELVTKVLEWRAPAEWWYTEVGWSYRDKLRWRSELSKKLKSGILSQIRSISGAEVANELEGTTQAIVTAPADVWERLLDPHNRIIPVESVQIYENDEISVPRPVESAGPNRR
jgi:hypothetical protein